jgi:chorismate mutase/prephenate dehydratase
MYFNSFDAVFNAVDKGLCKNGILPLENSLHGSVTEVYDLMKKYRFHITRSVKMKINHALLAKAGTRLPQIKEIYSHEQALMQCSEFLKGLHDIKIIDCKNTAMAAKMSPTRRGAILRRFPTPAAPNCTA